uniref:inositol-phosphate phosphatase n=1 Tax=Setaria digitata TaxID=48799 RepID=A0A915Q6Q1_9BILA
MKVAFSYVLLAAELGGRAVVDTNDEQKFSVFKKTETNVGKAELLTKADLLSNQLIIGVLQRYPGLKVTVGIVEDQVISEEKKEKLSAVDYEKYQSQQEELYGNVKNIIDLFPSRKYSLSKLTVWVDPLDATQEFTEGLLEYVSVMICIALDSAPIFGVIYRPFSGERMYGLNEFGIVKGNGDKWDATFLKNTSKLIVVSRSHAGKVKELALKAFHANFTIEAAGGSGYKSLRLLNGTAELYMHKTAIKKWDTCAGDALLRSIGGSMLDFKGDELNYDPDDDYVLRNVEMNKEEKILNDLALRKFQLASEFLALNGQMGTLLDNYRFNLSKTKSVVGLSAVSAGSIDNRDMESTVRIEISPDGIFSLVPSDASHPNKGNKAYQFRPFGVLEPLYAKAARSDVQKALPLICEIASAKHKLQEVEEEYRIMKKSLALT